MVPRFSMRSRRMISMAASSLLHDVGQQAQVAGALDRLGQLALLLGRNGGDAAGDDLAPLGHEALQQAHVLVVDPRRVLGRERAGLAAAEERAGHQSSPRSLWRFRSRSFLRIIADGPLSCSSTLTVSQRMTSSLIRFCRSSSATSSPGPSMLSITKWALRLRSIL